MKNVQDKSTNLLGSALIKDVERLLCTFPYTILDIRFAPVRLVTICRNSCVRNRFGKKSRSHVTSDMSEAA